MSYKFKLLCAFVLILIIPASIITYIFVVNMSSNVSELQQKLMASTVDNLKEECIRKNGILKKAGLTVEDSVGYYEDRVKAGIIEIAINHKLLSGYVFILGAQGEIIYHPNPDIRAELDFIQSIIQKKEGHISYTFNKKKYLAVFTFYPDWDWIITATVEESELFRHVFKSRNLAVFTLIIALIISITVLYFLAENITKPIRIFTENAEKIKNGNFDVQIDLKSTDEFGRLADAFNEMAARLKRSLESLHIEISDRKKAEKKYRSVFENAPIGLFQTTADGRFLNTNPALAKILGYPNPASLIEDVASIPEQLYIEPNRRSMLVEDALCQDRPVSYEVELYRKDRSVLTANIIIWTVRNENGRVRYLEGFLDDVTEKKKIEAQVQQAVKMEAIGTLAGGIAHDFNNLLMAIQGHVSLMFFDIDSQHPHYKRLQNIESSIERGAQLTKQLLGFAQEGKYEVKPVDLNQVIRAQNSIFGRAKKEITIHEKFEERLWRIEADQGQLEQTILNIYINAWQAMPDGGDLYIETANIVLDEKDAEPHDVPPGPYVRLSIGDSGIGMDETTQKRIFEPFFSTKGLGKGTGLGLASVYGIIKSHKGFITVNSEVGRGTTFVIYLPGKANIAKTQIPLEKALDV